MIIRPVFNILLLPDITYFFKRDFFPGAAADQIEVGTDILFPFLKNEVDETTVTIDDIYPIGMSARVESIGDDDSIQVRTLDVSVLMILSWMRTDRLQLQLPSARK